MHELEMPGKSSGDRWEESKEPSTKCNCYGTMYLYNIHNTVQYRFSAYSTHPSCLPPYHLGVCFTCSTHPPNLFSLSQRVCSVHPSCLSLYPYVIVQPTPSCLSLYPYVFVLPTLPVCLSIPIYLFHPPFLSVSLSLRVCSTHLSCQSLYSYVSFHPFLLVPETLPACNQPPSLLVPLTLCPTHPSCMFHPCTAHTIHLLYTPSLCVLSLPKINGHSKLSTSKL